MSDEKLNQLQLYEQSIQNLLLQKQQFQAQVSEIDAALNELPEAKSSYKIIGNIMVNASIDDLKLDLDARKAKAELRIKALDKQEESIKQKVKDLQEEVMQNMKNDS